MADKPCLCIVVRRAGKAEHDSLNISLDIEATVLDLKECIASTLRASAGEEQIPVERQRLIFSGKMLRDDAQSLQADLRMQSSSMENERKHFVHLAPLPKGATPSARTQKELGHFRVLPRTRAIASRIPHEENMRRARQIGERRRRRNREHQGRDHVLDAAAYRLFGLDNSRDLAPNPMLADPPSTNTAFDTSAGARNGFMLNGEVADLQRTLMGMPTSFSDLTSFNDFLPTFGSAHTAQAPFPAIPRCPVNQALIANGIAGTHAPIVPFLSDQFRVPQSISSSVRFPVCPEATLAASLLPPVNPQTDVTSATALSILEGILGSAGLSSVESASLPDVLDQVADNAERLATTIRHLQSQPHHARSVTSTEMPTPVPSLSSPHASAPPSQVVTPESGTSAGMSLQEQHQMLASYLSSASAPSLAAAGSAERSAQRRSQSVLESERHLAEFQAELSVTSARATNDQERLAQQAREGFEMDPQLSYLTAANAASSTGDGLVARSREHIFPEDMLELQYLEHLAQIRRDGMLELQRLTLQAQERRAADVGPPAPGPLPGYYFF